MRPTNPTRAARVCFVSARHCDCIFTSSLAARRVAILMLSQLGFAGIDGRQPITSMLREESAGFSSLIRNVMQKGALYIESGLDRLYFCLLYGAAIINVATDRPLQTGCFNKGL